MMVHNYEPRWRSQHVALVEYPLETRKSRENRWENAKYTSSTEGSRRGNSWTQLGVVKFHSLCERVKEQRDLEESGDRLEEYLRN